MVGITEIENPRFPQSPTNFFVQPLTSSIDQSHITYCAKPMGQAVSISYIERQSDELAEEFDVEMDLGLDDALEASNGVIKTAPQLEVMGIAAGGKLIQDLVADFRPPHMWNTSRTCLTNIHIFSPASFEAVTHIVPYDVPITAKDYADAGQPFFIVEEDTENRIDGSETLDAVKSVSEMDKQIGVDTTGASSADTKVPKQCGVCKVRLCDCM
jgi:hypothetical protein